MKINKNLVLIGMMGSGKSTLGYLISKKLDVLFIDIDRKIEEIEKMSISKIFKKHGEKYFRIIEEKITSEILKKNSVHLGGLFGMFEFFYITYHIKVTFHIHMVTHVV